MLMLIIQTLLLVLAAYILGCILGCLLKQWFGVGAVAATAAAPVVAKAIPTRPAPPAPVAAKPKPAPKRVAKPAPKPKAKAKPKPVAAKKTPDDLKRIKGIGRQNEARLNAVDVKYFAQIADWSKKDQQEMGERLAFPGRIEREEWVKQAKVLAKGGETNFSKRVAKGEISTSVGKGSVGKLGSKPTNTSKARGSKSDDLTQIDGVGSALEKKLNAIGIHSFAQIAAWSKDNQIWIGNELGFPGRPEREDWVKEAKKLSKG